MHTTLETVDIGVYIYNNATLVTFNFKTRDILAVDITPPHPLVTLL
jgi:hypothetical protein